MAYKYDFGPSLGEAFGRGVKSGLDAYDAQKQRRRQREDDEWRRELREHQRGLMPIQREQAQLGLRSSEIELEDKQRKAEAAAAVEAFKLLKSNQPQLAYQRYKQFDPSYAGMMPQPDSRKPGNWLIDLDGDGQLESINPDDIINHYEPPKYRAPQQHPQLGLGQFGTDGQWHGIEPKGTGRPSGVRGQKISELMSRGFGVDDAADLVDGRVRLTSPDQFGNIYLVNVATGERRQIAGQQVGLADGGFAGVQTPEGDVQFSGLGLDIESAAREGTGPFAAIRQGINNTIGAIMTGQPFPKTDAARTDLRLFAQEAKQALVNNPRFPVAEQQLINRMLPDPNRFLTDPDGEVQRVHQLHRFLSEKRAQNMRILEAGQITAQQRGDLMDQNASIDRVLGMMGPLSGQGQDQGVARPQSQLDYQQLPPGAQYVAPDGTIRVKR